jgi:hypothetical protein
VVVRGGVALAATRETADPDVDLDRHPLASGPGVSCRSRGLLNA